MRLPVIVNLDGFYLSFTREPVDIPELEAVRSFLPKFANCGISFRAGKGLSEGIPVLGGSPYSYFRYENHLACLEALEVFDTVTSDFEETFSRAYGPVECYRTEDAEMVFLMVGSFATKARDAVDRLRESGMKVGLVRPFLFRPFPEAAIKDALVGKKAVAVIDQNVSMGKGGILYPEVTSALYGVNGAPPLITSYIGGLGGRDIGPEEFYGIAKQTLEAQRNKQRPPPRLLYTSTELRGIRKLQSISRLKRHAKEPTT